MINPDAERAAPAPFLRKRIVTVVELAIRRHSHSLGTQAITRSSMDHGKNTAEDQEAHQTTGPSRNPGRPFHALNAKNLTIFCDHT